MHTDRDVILTVDYHLEHLEVRRLNCATGQEQRHNIPTTAEASNDWWRLRWRRQHRPVGR